MFLLIGVLCTLLTLTTIIMYLCMKSLKTKINTILFQILLIQFFISIKYLITGIAFKYHGDDLNHTPMGSMDFGLLSYDCEIEGLLAYMMFSMIILWNFVYTYEIYLMFNKPEMYDEDYLFYFKAFVYFTGVMFSIIVFFPNMEIFQESSIYI